MVNLSRLGRKKLGQILVEEGMVKEEQIQEALERQKKKGELLGEALVALGFLQEVDIALALAKQFNLPYIDASRYSISKELVELLPAEILMKNQFVILDKIGQALVVAVAGSINVELFEELEKRTGSQLFIYVSTPGQVRQALRSNVDLPAAAQ